MTVTNLPIKTGLKGYICTRKSPIPPRPCKVMDWYNPWLAWFSFSKNINISKHPCHKYMQDPGKCTKTNSCYPITPHLWTGVHSYYAIHTIVKSIYRLIVNHDGHAHTFGSSQADSSLSIRK